MYQVNRKLLNPDGSRNLERAMRAGRQARAEALKMVIEALRTAAGPLIRNGRNRRSADGARQRTGAGAPSVEILTS